jgi:hypothetical protein
VIGGPSGRRVRLVAVATSIVMGATASWVRAQALTQRGFVDLRGVYYPQTNGPDDEHGGLDVLARYEPAWDPAPWIRVAGAFDARADTRGLTDREWDVDWGDRGLERPSLSVRRLQATLSRGGLAIDAGKQFIRWGKTDILNPTDRFAPRDFLEVTDSEFLGVTAARVNYERGANTIDLVWVPYFTPSRAPLLGSRWAVLPPETAGILIVDEGSDLPGGSQYGLRWNRVASGYEFSICFYDGFNHLPLIDARPVSADAIAVTRVHPAQIMAGGDLAVPLPWFTLKSEAAYFRGDEDGVEPRSDDYVLYVVQVERFIGEWSLVGGYSGESVITERSALDFAPDRGLTRALVGRVAYTIDTNRSLAVEVAARQNGDGTWLKGEYSHATGQHWRTTVTASLIRGEPDDFLGQYSRNSHVTAALRYSF